MYYRIQTKLLFLLQNFSAQEISFLYLDIYLLFTETRMLQRSSLTEGPKLDNTNNNNFIGAPLFLGIKLHLFFLKTTSTPLIGRFGGAVRDFASLGISSVRHSAKKCPGLELVLRTCNDR